VPINLGAWWGEPEYRVYGTVTTKLHHEQEKEPQDITKIEWKVILEHMGPSREEIKDVQVKMGKWQ